ncbi:hypothetical protein VP01_1747g1 [Puccinia sorghi]|uniref:Uncharacterized protein n=1 Tax=Puccinia sorghi TaxID=27349 RepID=A0A0L6VF77_9BASI|nr:hypothetical protein VP01_1747g1 [Puccinia sorghi]
MATTKVWAHNLFNYIDGCVGLDCEFQSQIPLLLIWVQVSSYEVSGKLTQANEHITHVIATHAMARVWFCFSRHYHNCWCLLNYHLSMTGFHPPNGYFIDTRRINLPLHSHSSPSVLGTVVRIPFKPNSPVILPWQLALKFFLLTFSYIELIPVVYSFWYHLHFNYNSLVNWLQLRFMPSCCDSVLTVVLQAVSLPFNHDYLGFSITFICDEMFWGLYFWLTTSIWGVFIIFRNFIFPVGNFWGVNLKNITSQVELRMNRYSFRLPKKSYISFAHPIFLEIIFEFPKTVKDHNENDVIHAQQLIFCLEMIITHISYVDIQKLPGRFCCYSKHPLKVIQPSFDAQSLFRLHSDCAKSSTYKLSRFIFQCDILFLCYDHIENADKSLASEPPSIYKYNSIRNVKTITPFSINRLNES